jgi:transcriptional regulator with XRE-family HTH domain
MNVRSQWIRGLRGKLTQEDFARRLNVSQATASRWERNAEPTIENWEALMALAQETGYSLPDSSILPGVPLIGFVGAATEINLFGNGQGPFDYVEMPPNATENTVAVEVRGDSMSGSADDRYLLYYNNVQEPPTEALLGKLCVIALSDDRMLVKKLQRGRLAGRFDLYSTIGAPMLDQQVLWAAQIEWIRPR